jgi:aspartate racemase
MKTLGIIGGMGPYATIDLFKRIVDLTGAEKEWDNIHIIIDNNPHIPSRGRYFECCGESPLNELINSAKRLEQAGADFLIIGCNQAHYFYHDVQKAVSIPILNMIQLTVEHIKNKIPNISRVGVVGAKSTCQINYKKELEESSLTPIIPEDIQDYKDLRTVIDGVKAGKGDKFLLLSIISKLIDKGAEAIILGCTEFPILLKSEDLSTPIFDPNDITTKKVVGVAKEENAI